MKERIEGALGHLRRLLEGRALPRREVPPLGRQAESGDPVSQIFASIPDGLARFDSTGRIIQANQALADLFLTDRQSPIGKSALELIRSEELADAVKEALVGRRRQLTLLLPSGRSFLAFLSPLGGVGALAVLREVSEVRRMEQARRDFVSNASHELRTPVMAIAGAVETLTGGAFQLPPEATGFLEMIGRNAARLSLLTERLLDLTRLESGEWSAHPETLELLPVATACIELFKEKADKKNVQLVAQVPVGLFAHADPSAAEQILVNLLDNAIKYTPAGTRVIIAASDHDGEVEVAVIDDGAGIEARHIPRLFERFYRVDSGRARDAGGAGLGLSIVKHLAQAQGGSVGVESGQWGSRFWVRLPKP